MKTNKTCANLINVFLMLAAAFLLLAFCVDTSGDTLIRPQYIAIVIASLIIVFLCRKSISFDSVILTIVLGSILKLCYVAYTETWNRQHDVIAFGAGEGHAAYIEYILEHKNLPDFDPRTVWGFFQPPLHHIIAAGWMWLQRRLGVAQHLMEENVQLLTLFYMIITVIFTYLICREFDMKKRGMLITMLIVSFHPILVLFSGSINNDALALCLSIIAVYVAILWYREPKYLTIIILAVVIGLSMCAKLTAGLVAPAIGTIMIYSFIMNRARWKSYIGQFVVFGVIVAPVGLYWPIRNKILWGMPVNYIPMVGEQLEKTDFVSRVLDIRIHSVYPAMIANGDSYDEYNTFVQLMKSSLFGEYNYGAFSRVINPFAIILFIISIVLAIVALYATCYMIFSKRSMMNLDRKIFLGLLYIAFVAGYLSFSLGYSNFSAEDFRYSALAIIIEAVFLGLWADESEEKVTKTLLIACIVFAAASTAVYLLIGIFQ